MNSVRIKYVTVHLPKALMDQIDEQVKESCGIYSSRPDFIKEAVSEFMKATAIARAICYLRERSIWKPKSTVRFAESQDFPTMRTF